MDENSYIWEANHFYFEIINFKCYEETDDFQATNITTFNCSSLPSKLLYCIEYQDSRALKREKERKDLKVKATSHPFARNSHDFQT